MTEEAFIALYRREAEMLLLFCARRTLDPEVALDVTAETFAQAYRGRRRFRGHTAAEERAWLITIARRQLARFYERGTMDKRTLQRLAIQVPPLHEDDLAEIDRRAGLGELRATLATELERLTPEQREALQLRVVDELDYSEIAATLGIAEATVRARVSRGLRTLAAALPRQEATT